MNTLEAMDQLLVTAREQGREPVRFLVKVEDWDSARAAMGRDLSGPAQLVDLARQTFAGVPIDFSNLRESELAAIETSGGIVDVAEK